MPKEGFHRSQFTFYASYFEAVEQLPKARQLEAYRLITDYALHGTLPEEISPRVGALFAALRPNIDASRAKAKARLKELSGTGGERDVLSPTGQKIGEDLSPTGCNKKEKENKIKNKYKNECKEEREEEAENKGTFPCGVFAAGAASDLPSEAEREYSGLFAENPELREPMEQLHRYWSRQGQPLTGLDRQINVLALSVQEPEQQLESLRTMLQTGARLVPAAGRPTGT